VRAVDAAGLIVVQECNGLSRTGFGFAFDRAGTVRHRFDRTIVAGITTGADRLFLTDGDVRCVTPEDRTVWSVAFAAPEWNPVGEFVPAAGGDLLAVLYAGSWNNGVQVMRLDPATGALRWRSRCERIVRPPPKSFRTAGPPFPGDPPRSHYATAEWVDGRVRVISRGWSWAFVEWLDGRTGARLRRYEWGEGEW
jgi:outer membrane protein assembly factor BamB